MHTTPASLLARIKDPTDQASWRTFFAAYAPFIFSIARGQSLRHEDAEEVVQQVMSAVAGQIAGFEYDPSKGKFRNWLQIITRRRIVDLLQSHARDMGRRELQGEGDCPDATNPFDAIWEAEWQQALLREAVENARGRVGPDVFMAFWCRVIEEWSSKATAEFLETTVDAVNVNKHRVAKIVREQYEALRRQQDD